MFWRVVLCVFVAGIIGDGLAAKIPDYITLCKRDNKLNECWKKEFEKVVDHIKDGFPGMNLRVLDPLSIESLELNYGNGTSISFNAYLKDMKLYGLHQVHLKEVDIDLDNLNWNMTLNIPSLQMESNYRAKGKVLLLQFDGSGTFWGNFTDLVVTGNWKGEKYIKNKQVYTKFVTADIDVKINHLEMYFNNLFPNNEEITKSTNKAINDNIDSLYDEVKPIILETIKTVVFDSLNKVYKLFPMDYLYPKD